MNKITLNNVESLIIKNEEMDSYINNLRELKARAEEMGNIDYLIANDRDAVLVISDISNKYNSRFDSMPKIPTEKVIIGNINGNRNTDPQVYFNKYLDHINLDIDEVKSYIIGKGTLKHRTITETLVVLVAYNFMSKEMNTKILRPFKPYTRNMYNRAFKMYNEFINKEYLSLLEGGPSLNIHVDKDADYEDILNFVIHDETELLNNIIDPIQVEIIPEKREIKKVKRRIAPKYTKLEIDNEVKRYGSDELIHYIENECLDTMATRNKYYKANSDAERLKILNEDCHVYPEDILYEYRRIVERFAETGRGYSDELKHFLKEDELIDDEIVTVTPEVRKITERSSLASINKMRHRHNIIKISHRKESYIKEVFQKTLSKVKSTCNRICDMYKKSGVDCNYFSVKDFHIEIYKKLILDDSIKDKETIERVIREEMIKSIKEVSNVDLKLKFHKKEIASYMRFPSLRKTSLKEKFQRMVKFLGDLEDKETTTEINETEFISRFNTEVYKNLRTKSSRTFFLISDTTKTIRSQILKGFLTKKDIFLPKRVRRYISNVLRHILL